MKIPSVLFHVSELIVYRSKSNFVVFVKIVVCSANEVENKIVFRVVRVVEGDSDDCKLDYQQFNEGDYPENGLRDRCFGERIRRFRLGRSPFDGKLFRQKEKYRRRLQLEVE